MNSLLNGMFTNTYQVCVKMQQFHQSEVSKCQI